MSPLEYIGESLAWWHQYAMLLALFLVLELFWGAAQLRALVRR